MIKQVEEIAEPVAAILILWEYCLSNWREEVSDLKLIFGLISSILLIFYYIKKIRNIKKHE